MTVVHPLRPLCETIKNKKLRRHLLDAATIKVLLRPLCPLCETIKNKKPSRHL
jgi:hypothetical protein